MQTSQETVAAVVRHASHRLAEAGIDYSEYEAKVLFATAVECDIKTVNAWIATQKTLDSVQRINLGGFSDGIDNDESSILQVFSQLVNQRCQRIPLQYITGIAPYRYLNLRVGPGVFIPRPETEIIVDITLEWITRHKIAHPHVIDLCAGSGAIGLSIATEMPSSSVLGIEKDSSAFQWLERNAREVYASNAARSTKIQYQAIQADATNMTQLSKYRGTADCVVSNPPYVPDSQPLFQPEVSYDPHIALSGGSDDGMNIPTLIAQCGVELLKPGGLLIMEHDITQKDAMKQCFNNLGLSDVHTHEDLTHRPRFTSGIKPVLLSDPDSSTHRDDGKDE